MADIDIARALKDKAYFNSLTEEQKATVRAANPVGEATLDESDLSTVSGGLEGGDALDTTSTTTNDPCGCPASTLAKVDTEIGVGYCCCNC